MDQTSAASGEIETFARTSRIASAALAMSAARLSLELKLPMADSIVLATARASAATLWTQDDDFEGLDDVKYIAKKKVAK